MWKAERLAPPREHAAASAPATSQEPKPRYAAVRVGLIDGKRQVYSIAHGTRTVPLIVRDEQ